MNDPERFEMPRQIIFLSAVLLLNCYTLKAAALTDTAGSDTTHDSLIVIDSSDTAAADSVLEDSVGDSGMNRDTAISDSARDIETAAGLVDTADSSDMDSAASEPDFVAPGGHGDSSTADSGESSVYASYDSSDVPEKSEQRMKKYSIMKYIKSVSGIIKHIPLSSIFKYSFYFLVLIVSFFIIITVYNYLQRTINKKRFMTTTRLSVMDIEVRKACKYIEKNFNNPELTVDVICKDLVTGAAFLEALFNRELGMSVENFIKYVRINRACIIKSKNPLMDKAEAASLSGYKDPDKFIHDFNSISDVKFNDFKE